MRVQVLEQDYNKNELEVLYEGKLMKIATHIDDGVSYEVGVVLRDDGFFMQVPMRFVIAKRD